MSFYHNKPKKTLLDIDKVCCFYSSLKNYKIMKIVKNLMIILSLIAFTDSAFASRGGVNKDGCHTDKETGKYHCHNKEDKE